MSSGIKTECWRSLVSRGWKDKERHLIIPPCFRRVCSLRFIGLHLVVSHHLIGWLILIVFQGNVGQLQKSLHKAGSGFRSDADVLGSPRERTPVGTRWLRARLYSRLDVTGDKGSCLRAPVSGLGHIREITSYVCTASIIPHSSSPLANSTWPSTSRVKFNKGKRDKTHGSMTSSEAKAGVS